MMLTSGKRLLTSSAVPSVEPSSTRYALSLNCFSIPACLNKWSRHCTVLAFRLKQVNITAIVFMESFSYGLILLKLSLVLDRYGFGVYLPKLFKFDSRY